MAHPSTSHRSPSGSPSPGRSDELPETPLITPGLTGLLSPANILIAALVLILLLQRIVVPAGANPVQLTIPVTYGALVLLVATRQVTVDRVRAELFGVVVVALLIVTAVAAGLGSTPATTSLGLLIVLYLAWTVRVTTDQKATLIAVARGFVRTMVVFAGIGIVQLVSQFTGVWRYADYFRDLIGSQYISASFNTSIPLVYGSAVYKANAFVFLEPSFLSQFCALGALIAVVLRAPAWQVLMLVAGVFSAVSGTGIVLLLVGGLLLVIRAGWLIRPVHLVALAAATLGVSVSPVAPLLLRRVDETSQVGSSGNLRFVQPYAEVAQALRDEPFRLLVGFGAGSVERMLTSGREGGEPVVYTIVPKLVFEYGLLAGGLFILFIVVAVLDRGSWRVVPGSILVMIFVLSGSLLQPHTVFVAWLLTGLWTDQPGPRVDQMSRAELRALRRQPAVRRVGDNRFTDAPHPLLLD